MRRVVFGLATAVALGGCVTSQPTVESVNAQQAAMQKGCVEKGYKRGTQDFQTCLTLAQSNPSNYGVIDGNTATLMLIPLAVGAATISDERAKRDVVPVGTWKGLTVYRYRYRWSEEIHTGLMAQEVQRALPAAVFEGADGYLRIDYSKL